MLIYLSIVVQTLGVASPKSNVLDSLESKERMLSEIWTRLIKELIITSCHMTTPSNASVDKICEVGLMIPCNSWLAERGLNSLCMEEVL